MTESKKRRWHPSARGAGRFRAGGGRRLGAIVWAQATVDGPGCRTGRHQLGSAHRQASRLRDGQVVFVPRTCEANPGADPIAPVGLLPRGVVDPLATPFLN